MSARTDAGAAFRCEQARPAGSGMATVETTLAGVPAILRVPVRVTQPPILLWHGFGPPASERALMEALPLDEVPAVKVYLGLPLFGTRAPAGGTEELVRRQTQDVALLVFKPAVAGAADELPAVVDALAARGCVRPGDKIDLFGFSAGGAAALLALAEHKVEVASAVVLNTSIGLTDSVHAWERAMKRSYAWTPEARALAARADALHRAADIARGDPPPALLIVQGGGDAVLGTQSSTALRDALTPYYRRERSEDRLRLIDVAGMTHDWTGDARAVAELRQTIAAWYRRYR
ncbi:MAG TPA: prolyl oligopeptidase family serine peptidase [Mizugakiibacter sp.]